MLGVGTSVIGVPGNKLKVLVSKSGAILSSADFPCILAATVTKIECFLAALFSLLGVDSLNLSKF